MSREISIQEIIPFMKNGWVAMDSNDAWYWYERKPEMKQDSYWWTDKGYECCLSDCFNITSVVDWRHSLQEIKE